MSLHQPTYNTKLVLVKHFYVESEAAIYSARLRDAGISTVIQNDMAYVMLPVGEKGIRLLVLESDLRSAQALIKEMDQNKLRPVEESFHHADLEEILYQKSLHKNERNPILIYGTIVLSIILVVYACYLSGIGLGLYHL